MIGDVADYLGFGLACILFISSVVLIRPANGERPLLIGFVASAVFALIIAGTRMFALQHYTRPLIGYILCAWVLVKLWALYSAALSLNRPFWTYLRRPWRRG